MYRMIHIIISLQLCVFHLVAKASVWNLMFVSVTLDGQKVIAVNVQLLLEVYICMYCLPTSVVFMFEYYVSICCV